MSLAARNSLSFLLVMSRLGLWRLSLGAKALWAWAPGLVDWDRASSISIPSLSPHTQLTHPPVPGFWYTIESTAPSHLLHQFRGSIVAALESKRKTRVLMRAWSAKQRFPVKQWLEDLETLQSEAIRLHNKEASKKKRFTHKPLFTVPARGYDSAQASPSLLPTSAGSSTYQDSPPLSRSGTAHIPYRDLTSPRPRIRSASQPPQRQINSPGGGTEDDGSLLPPNPLYFNSNPFYSATANSSSDSLSTMVAAGRHQQHAYGALTGSHQRLSIDSSRSHLPSRDSSDSFAYRMMAPDNPPPAGTSSSSNTLRPWLDTHHRNSSLLSVNEVVGARTDYALQKVDPSFNDSTGEYYRAFEEKLAGLTAKNSESELGIEQFLVESERDWSKRFRKAKLGRLKSPLGRPGMGSWGESRNSSYNSITPSDAGSDDRLDVDGEDPADDEFLLGSAYKPPTGLKK